MLFSALNTSTNYSIYNNNNIFNLLIITMESMPNEARKLFIQNIKIYVGMTFLNDFKLYIFKKLPDSELLSYF